MFTAAGRFVACGTAGLARKSHTPAITVARSRERLQRMFRVEIFWWDSLGREAGLEWRAGGAANPPVERAHVNQRDFHRDGAVVVFGEA